MKTAEAIFSVAARETPSVVITQTKVFVYLSSKGWARQFAAFLRSPNAQYVFDGSTTVREIVPGTYTFSVEGEYLNDTTLMAKLEYDTLPTLD